MKKVLLIIAILPALFSCLPDPKKNQAEENLLIEQEQARMKYHIGDIIFLKPDSCKALLIGYKSKYLFQGAGEGAWYYKVRDCHGQECIIEQESFIYGKEN